MMPSNEGLPPSSRVFRVLIVGGSYGGLAAALTLADLTRGHTARFNYDPQAKAPPTGIPIQITVVDERDGYCTSTYAEEELPYTKSTGRPPHWITQSPSVRKVRPPGLDTLYRYPGPEGPQYGIRPGQCDLY